MKDNIVFIDHGIQVAQTVRIRLHCGRPGFDPWVGKIPWRRAWQPIPVFLPGKSHGQRSLAGYSPWGSKESDTTERLSTQEIGNQKLRGQKLVGAMD